MKAWLPKEGSENLFGLDRNISSIRFHTPYKKRRFERLQVLWGNFKSFIYRRWRYEE